MDREELVKAVKDRIIKNIDLSNVTDDNLREIIESNMFECIGKSYVSLRDKGYIVRSVFNAIRGNGILDNILEDDEITEVMINGYDRIFIEKNGCVSRYPGSFESDERLRDIIQKIVGNTGREVNNSSPIVDTRLEDGSRVNIILPPLALCGPTMTIRKFSKEPMTMERLINYGSITQEIADVLKLLVEAKYNIFICGGTGSGKTTFLNALSNYIPSNERIITIEDSAELQIRNIDNLVSLETRNSNTSGKGEVTIRELIKNALRMRPERIIVGEVRGAEALDMLQAMNTGHDGSLSTGHANSSRDMMFRLETMVLQGASNLPLDAIRQQIGSAIDIVIHLSRLRDKSRRVVEISEVCGCENGQVVLKPLYVFKEDTFYSTKDKVVGGLERTNHRLENDFKLKLAGFDEEF
jgi:pilus assembly protein CpaF